MALLNYFGLYTRDQIQRDIQRAMAGQTDSLFFQTLNNDIPSINPDSFDYIQNGYMTVSAVYECIDLIMKKVVASPAIVYEVKSAQGLKMYDNLMKSDNIVDRAKAMRMKSDVLEEVLLKPVQDLLDYPNARQTWDEMIGLAVVLYLATGNALIYGNGSPQRATDKKWSEVFSLPYSPNDITIVGGKSIFDPVKEYKISAHGSESLVNFDAELIEHIKTVNPLWDGTGGNKFGMSPLRAYCRKLIRERLGDDQANKILNNGGSFGVLSPKNKEDQFQSDQKKALHERLTDASRSNEPLARIFPSSVPLEWLQIGLPTTDLQLLELSKASREDVYRGYHVPLTYASTDQASYNNANAHGKQLIYNAVAPICEVFSRALTNFIAKPYNTTQKKYTIRLDYMSLPELSQDMKEVAEWLEKCDDITPNEKREVKGFGRKDAEGMDDVWVNKSKVRMIDIVNGKVNTDNIQEVSITE